MARGMRRSSGPANGPGLSYCRNSRLRLVKLTRVRLASQIAFFALFLFLLLRTEFRGTFQSASADIRLPYPVHLFFQIDPLAALTNALASRALYRGLLWSLL